VIAISARSCGIGGFRGVDSPSSGCGRTIVRARGCVAYWRAQVLWPPKPGALYTSVVFEQV
jgi:hypothetical protein